MDEEACFGGVTSARVCELESKFTREECVRRGRRASCRYVPWGRSFVGVDGRDVFEIFYTVIGCFRNLWIATYLAEVLVYPRWTAGGEWGPGTHGGPGIKFSHRVRDVFGFIL